MPAFPENAPPAMDSFPSLENGETAAWEAANREEREYRARERIRTECRAALAECAANRRTAMTWEDVQEYERTGLEEGVLAYTQSEEEKTQALLQHKAEYVPLFIRKAEEAGARALASIGDAVENGWITAESGRRWEERLKSNATGWLEKESFINHQLPRFVENWKAVAEDLKKAESLATELKITEAEWASNPALAALRDAKFPEQHFNIRRGAVDKAIAFLTVLRKDGKSAESSAEMQRLYKMAEAKLTRAAQNGFLASWKVGTWMRRIFQGNARETLIRDFVEGRGKTDLDGLIRNWANVSMEYMNIEDLRKEKGTPRSFSFVALEIFLGWDYEKRKAYVGEARRRFSDIDKERDAFLRIRHALDVKDWDEAEELIGEEWKKAKDMTPEDEGKLRSMQEYLRTHRPAGKRQEKKEKPTDQELVEQMRSLMLMLPASQRKLHEECLRRGYTTFWTNCTAWYNLVWCQEHLWWDPKTQLRKEQEAKQFTPDYIQKGHRKGFEANELRGANNTHAAVREQKDMGAPQWTYIGEESWQTAADLCQRQRDNRKWWYYTSFIPEGVPYSQHRYVVKNIHPQMKRLCREMEQRGILFTQNGTVRHIPTGQAHRVPEASLN
ncbi:MAG: hypothetical protein WCV62_03965 [Candidatus Peribacteraceae bacterium]|jgi:hypothetical protein